MADEQRQRKRITVAFEGNGEVSAGTLRDVLTLLTRGSYDDYEVAPARTRSSATTRQHGYFFARVDWRRERLSADEERMVFTIDEGPSCRCAASSSSATRLSAPELAGVVSVRTYPPLGLGAGGYVTGRQLDQDVERLVAHYRARGFPRRRRPRRQPPRAARWA